MITLYSKPMCPFCDSAKLWLNQRSMPFTVVDVSEDVAALAFLRAKGHRTVPQLYVGDTLFVAGGYNGMVSMGEDEFRRRLAA